MSSDSQTKNPKKRPAVEISDGEDSEEDFQPKIQEKKSGLSKKKKKRSGNNDAANNGASTSDTANNAASTSGAAGNSGAAGTSGAGDGVDMPSINVIPVNTGPKPKLDHHLFVDPSKRTEFKAVRHMKQCYLDYRYNFDKPLSDGSNGFACEEKRPPQKCPGRMRVYEDGTNKVTREHNHDPSGVKTKKIKVSF